jgi:uncharacterized repeat protein (TIGR04138 family)
MTGSEHIDPMNEILARDPRYQPEAYEFVRDGLGVTVRKLKAPRHISGQELLAGLRTYALKEFGPMAKTVLNGWGICRTEDFGAIVFNLVDAGLLGKTEEDRLDDFSDGYDFDEAFRRPFLPSAHFSQ